MSVGERHYKIRLADTEAARAFSSLIPLTLEMADLNSNEKYVDLAVSLPKDASVPGTIKVGTSCCMDRRPWWSSTRHSKRPTPTPLSETLKTPMD
ncbi:cyclophilin-like fold protein [Pseudomonas faucium]|uniref:cyclophilin-like fold protein n=1 Tax=Pseudomonas faucium TaxID=2740518 RepID=UPI001EEDC4A9|nr:cyclophilin-like fold protein [Pseudomonas faucium]